MKSMIILAVFLFAIGCINAEYTHGHDGRPCCDTEQQVQREVYRNNFDPVHYWKCVELNSPAEKVACPPETGFIDDEKHLGCVGWVDWVWSEPRDPPSKC